MSNYRHNGIGEEAGDIGFKVLDKHVDENGFVILKISKMKSTMPRRWTNEIERIAHGLRTSEYLSPSTGQMGFPYTFGEFIFGR